MMIEYTLIRSKRRTVSLEVGRDLTVIVRAPLLMPKSSIDRFVKQHEKWVESKKAIISERGENEVELSHEDVAALKSLAKEKIPPKVAHFAAIMGLTPSAVKITSAKKRFGSCSGKHSLCFSYELMRYPERAIDYVVVHELAHIAYHNHSANFYRLIEKYMPDYKKREALLKNK